MIFNKTCTGYSTFSKHEKKKRTHFAEGFKFGLNKVVLIIRKRAVLIICEYIEFEKLLILKK